MVTLVKKEWHQVTREFEFDFTEDQMREIYPDADDDEIGGLMLELMTGTLEIDELMDEASNMGVDIDWEPTYDDWWTERKGGYDVTYEVSDGDQ